MTVLICVHVIGYGFLKWPERTEISRILMGRGLLWADGEHTPFPGELSLTFHAGEIHKRQRKVMLPGFGGRLLNNVTET